MATDYEQKLLDGRWQRKRLEVFEAADFRCVKCGAQNNLQVHHHWYIKDHEPWDYELSQLTALCGTCHERYQDIQNKLKRLLSNSPIEVQECFVSVLQAKRGRYKTIGITATNGDTEPHRFIRLNKLMSIAQRIDPSVLLFLVHIHDHKGCLECTWVRATDEESFRTMEQIWRDVGEDDVRHYVIGDTNDSYFCGMDQIS